MVKVGNSECGLAKLTPLSRIAAMVGAVSGVTLQGAQAVRHEQDQVALGLGAGGADLQRDGGAGQRRAGLST